MEIALYHNHYNQDHLEKVTAEMQELGTPKIRAIWSEMWGIWLAVEGCHRLRAAAALGLTPEIINISDDETVTIQCDGYDETFSVFDLLCEMHDDGTQEIIEY